MPRYDWTDDGYYVTEKRDLRAIRRVLIVTMLLNFLAIFDAWGGPVFLEAQSPEEKKGREEEMAAEEKAASSES